MQRLPFFVGHLKNIEQDDKISNSHPCTRPTLITFEQTQTLLLLTSNSSWIYIQALYTIARFSGPQSLKNE